MQLFDHATDWGSFNGRTASFHLANVGSIRAIMKRNNMPLSGDEILVLEHALAIVKRLNHQESLKKAIEDGGYRVWEDDEGWFIREV